MSQSLELISVVVIGRNEEARLERCLLSVARMHREGFAVEVIYVDSGSTDNSLEVARRLGAKTVALLEEHPTAALGRNAGWHLAQGKFVLFLDGDTVLDAEFVLRSLADFKLNTAVVWGHRRELHPRASVYQRVLDLDWVYPAGESAFCGGDALFRHDVLERTSGFDPYLIAGEEPELCRRLLELGYIVQHVDRAMTGHDLGIMRLGQYWRRAMRAGHAYAEVSERYAISANPLWKRESRDNHLRALTLVLIAVLAAVATVLLERFWPLAAWIAGLCMLAIRTAWKSRWKTRNWYSLLLYGFHSHGQQIPIYLGQMRYRWNRKRGRRTDLFEYKRRHGKPPTNPSLFHNRPSPPEAASPELHPRRLAPERLS